MRTRSTLHASQHGAKQLLAQYGDRLLCARYRYDEQRKKRFKTVELIVEKSDWEPQAHLRAGESLVKIRVAVPEAEIRRQVKRAGGEVGPFGQEDRRRSLGNVIVDSPFHSYEAETTGRPYNRLKDDRVLPADSRPSIPGALA